MAGAIGRTHRSAPYVDNANDNMSGYNDVRVGADQCVCPKGATSLVSTPKRSVAPVTPLKPASQRP